MKVAKTEPASRKSRLTYLGLAFLTLVAYWPVLSADFIDFDDPSYVTLNPHVRSGLSVANWVWAWTSFECSNWHPLTWLSLQLDAQLYGNRAAGFHVTNVLIHIGSVLLLFGWLSRLTRATGQSLMVAALFAVHPLHVESVGWISERKDVLSTLLGIGALFAYTEYVRSPSLLHYLAVCGIFALSLAAKPMWVTLPFLLLLLDFWPLKRWSASQQQSDKRWMALSWLIVEKVPLGLMTLASCVVTIVAQKSAIGSLDEYPFAVRVGNAMTACCIYIGKTFWPSNLAIYYPYPIPPTPSAIVVGCGSLLLLITILANYFRRFCPAILMGWTWFLATLVPVIGIVQVGSQAYADRYTYLPHIGLFVAVIWGVSDIVRWYHFPPKVIKWLCVLIVATCSVMTWIQTNYWRTDEILWRRALAVTQNNDIAHLKLWKILDGRGEKEKAFRHLEEAVRARPQNQGAQYNMGNVLIGQGLPEKAESYLRTAVKLNPEHGESHQALGIALATQGRGEEALIHLNEATRLLPDDGSAWINLGVTALDEGSFRTAISSLTRATQLLPGRHQPLILLASAEFEQGEIKAAMQHYSESLKLDPNWPAGTNRAAWTLSTHSDQKNRNGRRAVKLARRVCQATENKRPDYLDTLAAAYAEAGQFAEAIKAAEEALRLTNSQAGQSTKAARELRLGLYRQGQPFRQHP